MISIRQKQMYTAKRSPSGGNSSRSSFKSSRGSNSSSRPSFSSSSRGGAGNGGSSSYRGSRSGGVSSTYKGGGFNRNGNGGGRGGGNRSRRGPKKDFINENLFINKAVKKEEEVYKATHTFATLGLQEKLLQNLISKGFVSPSPIQDQSIPVAMKGGDVIGIASTGTGKTAAFLIPLIEKLMKDKSKKVMVLAPTRELAQQIEVEFKLFTRGMGLWSVTCVGGSPIGRQISELKRGVSIVIGTPGRVKDLITRKQLVMNSFNSIVLDEADRMLDMGFIDDMKLILGLMPKDKQGFFFSATFSPEIKNLCKDFLRDPVTVSVKTRDTSSNVDQDVVRIRDKSKKIESLHDILIKPEANKVLIFREMKRHVDDLAKELRDRGFKAVPLHGDMRNRERERAVASLANGSAQVLIATDVAARGIDIKDITHVINYDVPSTYDTYIHRIGRTGRAGQGGIALTFI